MAASDPEQVRVWLVDGFNVLHAGVLRGRDRAGWWKAERRDALIARAERFCPPGERGEVWIVFDGQRPLDPAQTDSASTHVVFAPSADDWLVARVREAPDPRELVVVTGDRSVAGKVRHRGARVISPRSFLARCPDDGQAAC